MSGKRARHVSYSIEQNQTPDFSLLMEAALSTYEADILEGSGKLRNLLACDPLMFRVHALSTLSQNERRPACDLLGLMLSADDEVLQLLLDPALLTRPELARVFKNAPELGTNVSQMIVQRFGSCTEALRPATAMRIVEIASSLEEGPNVLTVVRELTEHTSERVRSKAVLALGRATHDFRLLESQVTDPDSRIRANAVESLWGVRSATVIRLFRRALADPNHRVIANASIGLYRAGCVDEARDSLIQMMKDSDPAFRAAAAWAMNEMHDPEFSIYMHRFRTEPESNESIGVGGLHEL